MAQQPPPAGSFPPNHGYMQPQQQAPHQNGNNQHPGLVNGGYPPAMQKPVPMGIPQQQLPPQQQAINYQKFQTNALQPGAGLNGSNSALSSRTSSPGVQPQPAQAPPSQLPPSKSFPSYQQFQGALPQQQAPPPSSQLPTNNNINNNGDSKTGFTPLSPMNPAMPNLPPQGPGPMMAPQSLQQPPSLSTSMKNLAINPGQPGSFPTSPMPSSKSEQNFLNNNNNTNQPGPISNPPMPQIPMPKPNSSSNLAKRPMYPAQQAAPAPMSQPQQFQQQPGQPQGFNNFPGHQMHQPMSPMQQPQMQNPQMPQQQPQQQPRGNLQYQNLQQQPQQQQQQQQFPHPGSVVQQGFNRMWGNENVDLMQHRHILPPTKVLPPVVKLNHQFHEATNCNADIFRCTLTKIPESNSLLQKSRLPLGILIHPYRDLSVSEALNI